MNIIISAVGRQKNSPEQEIFNEYVKRTRWNIKIKEIECKKEKEGEMLLAACGKAKKIVLDEKGKILSTHEFTEAITKLNGISGDGIAFLIGGADGHSETVRKNADLILSLGKMTWPHMLVRPMLAEQIYRAYCITSNHPYHRS